LVTSRNFFWLVGRKLFPFSDENTESFKLDYSSSFIQPGIANIPNFRQGVQYHKKPPTSFFNQMAPGPCAGPLLANNWGSLHFTQNNPTKRLDFVSNAEINRISTTAASFTISSKATAIVFKSILLTKRTIYKSKFCSHCI
jgi:hypothetical protein